jgi:hypothetical protein
MRFRKRNATSQVARDGSPRSCRFQRHPLAYLKDDPVHSAALFGVGRRSFSSRCQITLPFSVPVNCVCRASRHALRCGERVCARNWRRRHGSGEPLCEPTQSYGGPRVRIHFPPAVSHLRTIRSAVSGSGSPRFEKIFLTYLIRTKHMKSLYMRKLNGPYSRFTCIMGQRSTLVGVLPVAVFGEIDQNWSVARADRMQC